MHYSDEKFLALLVSGAKIDDQLVVTLVNILLERPFTLGTVDDRHNVRPCDLPDAHPDRKRLLERQRQATIAAFKAMKDSSFYRRDAWPMISDPRATAALQCGKTFAGWVDDRFDIVAPN